MMFVDDISYTPASASELDIKCYNVWRDGILVGTVGADVTSFTDEAPDCADPAYVLTVLYDKGESAPTAEVHISASGLSAVGTVAPVISAVQGFVTVANAEGIDVAVVAPDGTVIATGHGAASMRIPVAPGIYIVTAGDVVAKVAVE